MSKEEKTEATESPISRALPFGRMQAMLLGAVLVAVGVVIVYKSQASSNTGWSKLMTANGCEATSNGMPATIDHGDTGNCVEFAQFLIQLGNGHIGGPPAQNGTFDEATTEYVKQFQSQNGLVPNGIIGPATWRHLDACVNSTALTITNTWTCPKLTP